METETKAEKPRSVGTAVMLLWASLALGLVKIGIDYSRLGALGHGAFISFVVIFILLLMAFLIVMTAAGKNWARITYLVLFVIGLLPALYGIGGELSRSLFFAALSIVQIGLQAYALFLLFTAPGSGWFRKAAAS